MKELPENAKTMKYEHSDQPVERQESKVFNWLDNVVEKIGSLASKWGGSESGYYLPPSESQAFAEAAQLSAGADISAALNTTEFKLAVQAVKGAIFPQGPDVSYNQMQAAISDKYRELEGNKE